MKPGKSPDARRFRIFQLDVLRGFALFGILPVNIYQQLVIGPGNSQSFPSFVEIAFYDRFLPIFAVLFGMGFGIFLERAGDRTKRPRVVLARRLGFLLLLGIVHFVLQPGEVLTAYAVGGLVFLLPVSYLRPRVALLVGIVALLIGAQIVLGYGIIPGLLIVGYALARLGLPAAIANNSRVVNIAFCVSAPLAIVWNCVLALDVTVPMVNFVGGLGGGTGLLAPLGGIVTAVAYATALLLILRTSWGHRLSELLAPMGRMALTNYIAATVLFLIGGALLSVDAADDAPQVAILALLILVGQVMVSRTWLRHLRFGPLEWLWRAATWLTWPPFRKAHSPAAT